MVNRATDGATGRSVASGATLSRKEAALFEILAIIFGYDPDGLLAKVDGKLEFTARGAHAVREITGCLS